MSDLIDRRTTINRLIKERSFHDKDSRIGIGIDIARMVIQEYIPATHPERKRGKWIKHPEQKNIYGGKIIECSECGTIYVVQDIKDEKYCRDCGSFNGGEQK